MSYSTELREKAFGALQKGYSKKQVNEMFNLGINTLRSWKKLEEETGSLKNRPLERNHKKIEPKMLLEYCQNNPFATHIEASIYFGCTETAIRKAKKKLQITRKKRHPDT